MKLLTIIILFISTKIMSQTETMSMKSQISNQQQVIEFRPLKLEIQQLDRIKEFRTTLGVPSNVPLLIHENGDVGLSAGFGNFNNNSNIAMLPSGGDGNTELLQMIARLNEVISEQKKLISTLNEIIEKLNN